MFKKNCLTHLVAVDLQLGYGRGSGVFSLAGGSGRQEDPGAAPAFGSKSPDLKAVNQRSLRLSKTAQLHVPRHQTGI